MTISSVIQALACMVAIMWLLQAISAVVFLVRAMKHSDAKEQELVFEFLTEGGSLKETSPAIAIAIMTFVGTIRLFPWSVAIVLSLMMLALIV